MKNLVFIILILLICSCTNRKGLKKDPEADGFFDINFEQALDNKQELSLSQMASDVEYVKLETDDDYMVRPVVRYFFTDSLIFISNNNEILKFSRDGKFLKKIGAPGKGPGEIDLIRCTSFLPDERLIAVQLNWKRELLFFSFDGELVKTEKFDGRIWNIMVLPGKKYIDYEVGGAGTEEYTFCLMDENRDTLSVVQNYGKWVSPPRTMSIMIGYPDFEPFYFARGIYHFKAMYNDTVYFEDSGRILPGYFIDMGKYRLPDELRPERLGPEQVQKFMDNSDNYCFPVVQETGNRIFLTGHSYGEQASKLILYDKSDHEGLLLTDSEGDAKGFINDWDGGPDFWPVGSVNDNQVFMPLTVMNLQKIIEKNKEKKRDVRYPVEQTQLEELVSGSEVTDNPILMIVTLKNSETR
ncbi:MAG: 6-bladed beta-propeller [Bacteroidales bacterium]|jgi:hypothetical protein|nr:6-bladed beta-propeller [Bacteroidales bacterium]OQB60935.1 MAG: hypothetical protein BWX96_01988 [Bacteroidetes bacterium ADurb.Bin145]HOU02374.1 6-bladed beta-propeller [Bacteroidales bacterium]HQK69447.1 6-bladed beta-propeller [Bacteroidales bacterium]